LLCLDGNFDQRRLKHAGSGDQPVPGAFTYFLSADEVAAAKRSTEQAMGKKKKPFADEDTTDPDSTLPGLGLPEHIYSGCKKRFFAADEDNKKGETSVFSDTGLMAMVCRHDRVLFVANLRDSGEKRYYALALLKRLFQELPASWTAGILYDIGCQLHQTITKVCLHPWPK
jgi:Kyakuja-Dileera-Zisupton transposase